jgi:hypothetical protein
LMMEFLLRCQNWGTHKHIPTNTNTIRATPNTHQNNRGSPLYRRKKNTGKHVWLNIHKKRHIIPNYLL